MHTHIKVSISPSDTRLLRKEHKVDLKRRSLCNLLQLADLSVLLLCRSFTVVALQFDFLDETDVQYVRGSEGKSTDCTRLQVEAELTIMPLHFLPLLSDSSKFMAQRD